jgi:hypothetical protein
MSADTDGAEAHRDPLRRVVAWVARLAPVALAAVAVGLVVAGALR